MAATLGVSWSVAAQAPPEGGEGMIATVHLGGDDYTYREADGQDLGVFRDPRGHFTVTCRRVKTSDCPLELDFRRITGTDGWDEAYIVFYQGDPRIQDGIGYYNQIPEPDIGAYRVTIAGDFTGSLDVPFHHRFTRTRWCSWGAPDLWPYLLTDFEALIAEGTVERYSDEWAAHTEANNLARPYSVMGIAGGQSYQMHTGVSQDMLTLSGPQGEYLARGNPEAFAQVMADAEGGNTYHYHWRDPERGCWLDRVGEHRTALVPPQVAADNQMRVIVTNTTTGALTVPDGAHVHHPGDWYISGVPVEIPAMSSVELICRNAAFPPPSLPTDEQAMLVPAVAGLTAEWDMDYPEKIHGDGITLDYCHFHTPAYLPYLLTRDPYHLESLQAEANLVVLQCGCEQGLPMAGPTRGFAWTLRTVAQAVIATPDVAPSWLLPRASFAWALDTFRANTRASLVDNPDPAIQSLRMYTTWTAPGDVTLWQEDYLFWAASRCVVADRAGWTIIAQWLATAQVHRLGGASGWCPYIPTTYWICCDANRDQHGHTPVADWAEAWELNATWQSQIDAGNIKSPCPGSLSSEDGPANMSSDYLTTQRAALAAMRQHGVCDAVPGFLDAVAFFLGELDPLVMSGDRYLNWNRCLT